MGEDLVCLTEEAWVLSMRRFSSGDKVRWACQGRFLAIPYGSRRSRQAEHNGHEDRCIDHRHPDDAGQDVLVIFPDPLVDYDPLRTKHWRTQEPETNSREDVLEDAIYGDETWMHDVLPYVDHRHPFRPGKDDLVRRFISCLPLSERSSGVRRVNGDRLAPRGPRVVCGSMVLRV